MTDTDFAELIRRLQAGDEQATTELVQRYAPEVQLAVRALLTDPGLRREFDSLDVVQSVLYRFCARAAQGRFQLDSPAHLVALLKQMAYRKFLDRRRRAGAQERDYRRIERRDDALAALLSDEAGPSTIAAWRDEYREVRRRLTDEERTLLQRWARGEAWTEIAGPQREQQDRLRHRLEGAFARVARQLSQLRDEPVAADYLKAVCRWVIEQSETSQELGADTPPGS